MPPHLRLLLLSFLFTFTGKYKNTPRKLLFKKKEFADAPQKLSNPHTPWDKGPLYLLYEEHQIQHKGIPGAAFPEALPGVREMSGGG